MTLWHIRNGNLLIYEKNQILKNYYNLINMESYYMYSFYIIMWYTYSYGIAELLINVYYNNPNDMTKLKIDSEKH